MFYLYIYIWSKYFEKQERCGKVVHMVFTVLLTCFHGIAYMFVPFQIIGNYHTQNFCGFYNFKWLPVYI